MPPGKSKKGGKNARRGKRDEQVSLFPLYPIILQSIT
jgi:hypothetical protein